MSFAVLLFVVFLVLKLVGVIAWSWLWVTAPLWIGAALWIIFVLIWGAVVGLFGLASSRESRKRW